MCALALSGGMDSRIVAAALERCGIPYTAVTRLDFEGRARSDVRSAEQVARVLRKDWQFFRLAPPTGSDVLRLLRTQAGLVSLGMSDSLPFFEQVKGRLGARIVLFTGATGVNLRSHIPSRRLRSIYDVVDELLDSGHARFAIQDVAEVVGLGEHEIREGIADYLSDCPEPNVADKYVHFIIHGRCINWLYVGVDRHRAILGTTQPLEANAFANYAIECSDAQKARLRISREILLELCPEAASVPYVPYGFPITSRIFRVQLWLKSAAMRLPRPLRQITKRAVAVALPAYRGVQPKRGHPGPLLDCLRDQTQGDGVVGEYFRVPALMKLAGRCDSEQLWSLFTLTSAIELFGDHRSSIAAYGDVPMT